MAKVGLLRQACIILVVCTATAIAASAQTFTTLFSFDSADGAYPSAGLVRAADGDFYGTTSSGGAGSSGTVFKITPEGTLTTLYSFCSQMGCADGATPQAGLIQATDGKFYGTTSGGGVHGKGTVFKITTTGTLTTLYSFCSLTNCADGWDPLAGLIQATDGNFYGTTWGSGGSVAYGTVFKITPAGTLTTLHSFCPQYGCADGGNPYAGLIQAADGNFYGTTKFGGANDRGTVFKITPAGALTTLYSFCSLTNCRDGMDPVAGLIQATDGDFYGTTQAGGHTPYGTVFKITPAGALTTLYSFCSLTYCHDGSSPDGGLVQAADGNFYGTASHSGAYGWGTLFEITAGGTLATLRSFNFTDGVLPLAGLVQVGDGSFYGTTAEGGDSNNCQYGCGTVFRLAVATGVTLSTNSLNFGNQALNQTSAAKTVTLKNSGTALLMINSVAIEGSSFAISANTCSGAVLAVGKACVVSVTFTPTVLGTLTGTLSFTDNASNSPQKVPLSGTGAVPATLMPTSALFGWWAVGMTSTAKAFTLANNQNVALTSIAISTNGDFAMSATTCTTSLAAKGKCTISVTFTPKALGTRTGQLSVSDSASNSPQTVALTGTGVEPAILMPSGANFGTWTVGTPSTAKTFTLSNYQNVALTSIAISTTGDFAVSTTTCTTSLASQRKCTINVKFTPAATGTRTGTLSVSDSANNSPQTSKLTGTGK